MGKDNMLFIPGMFKIEMGPLAIYAFEWALRKCGFFSTMLLHCMQETITGTCSLHLEEYEDLFCLMSVRIIIRFLHTGILDVDEENWQGLLCAADFLDCPLARDAIEQYLLKSNIITEANCVDTAEVTNLDNNWGLLNVYHEALEIVKGSMKRVVSSGEFLNLSFRSLKEIFSDPRMTYFTMEERYALLTKWAAGTDCLLNEVAELFKLIDLDKVPLRVVRDIAISDMYELRKTDIDNRLRRSKVFKETKPLLVVAAGTGDDYSHDLNWEKVWPKHPSSSLYAFDFVDEQWARLPDLPVAMERPFVTGNGKNSIFIIDSQMHTSSSVEAIIFCLQCFDGAWFWRSIQFDPPYEFLNLQIFGLHFVRGSLYLVAGGNVYTDMFSRWDEGEEVRRSYMLKYEGSTCTIQQGVVLLLKVDPASGACEIVSFLFETVPYFLKPIQSCVSNDKICVHTKSASPLNTSKLYPRSWPPPRFAVYDCVAGAVTHNEEAPALKSTPSYGCQGYLMPTTNQDGVMTVFVTQSFSQVFMFSTMKWHKVYLTIPRPHGDHLEEEELHYRLSYGLVARRGKLYCFGGWAPLEGRPVNSFLRYKYDEQTSHFDEAEDFETWQRLPYTPELMVSTGFTVCRLSRECVCHHVQCPHCLRHPQDCKEASYDDVRLPTSYR